MPMEEIIIVAIVFGSILAMVKLILDHAASRRSSSLSDRSMTTHELEGMIDEAVDRTTQDLRRRIENLEAIASAEDSAASSRLLDDPGQYGDLIEGKAGEVRRTRS